jgi:hypothetical protein
VLGFRKRRKRQGDGRREYFCLSWRHLALFAVKKEKRLVTAKGAKEREEESLFWNIVFCLYSLSWRHLALFAVKKEKRMVTAKDAKGREGDSPF